MAYAGEVLNQCGLIEIDFDEVQVIAVSGDGPNVCGHMLLHTGRDRGGYYFHVAELNGFPRYMNDSGYRRYLRESGKTELRRLPVKVPNPSGALSYLEGLMANKWTWLVIPNNCVAFVEDALAAGGATWASTSNCPAVAVAPTIRQRVEGYLNGLEADIYRAYGVPR